jgi:hypothetical protein
MDIVKLITSRDPCMFSLLVLKGRPGAAAKLLPCDYVVMSSSPGKWKQPLAEMQGKATHIRSKVVGPFVGPCASGCF